MLAPLVAITSLAVGSGLLYARADWNSIVLAWGVLGGFFYLFSSPIHWANPEGKDSKIFFLAILTVIASVLQSFLLLSLSLTASLWLWLKNEKNQSAKEQLQRLLVLPFCALPWLNYDLGFVGWYFRLSAAWFTDVLLSTVGLEVTRSGTDLQFSNFLLRVEAACSGLSFLHALVLVGAYLIASSDKQSRPWTFYLWLLPLAWLANSLRVTLLAIAALVWGVEAVAGDIHLWLGWVCFVVLFALWWRVVDESSEY